MCAARRCQPRGARGLPAASTQARGQRPSRPGPSRPGEQLTLLGTVQHLSACPSQGCGSLEPGCRQWRLQGPRKGTQIKHREHAAPRREEKPQAASPGQGHSAQDSLVCFLTSELPAHVRSASLSRGLGTRGGSRTTLGTRGALRRQQPLPAPPAGLGSGGTLGNPCDPTAASLCCGSLDLKLSSQT